jgi:hypothetical protein
MRNLTTHHPQPKKPEVGEAPSPKRCLCGSPIPTGWDRLCPGCGYPSPLIDFLLMPSDGYPTYLRELAAGVAVCVPPKWWDEGEWHIRLEENVAGQAWPGGDMYMTCAAVFEAINRLPAGWGVPAILRFVGGLGHADICKLLLLKSASSTFRACEKAARCIKHDLCGTDLPREEAIKPRWHVSVGVRDAVLGLRSADVERMATADASLEVILGLKQKPTRAQRQVEYPYESIRTRDPDRTISERIR